MANAISEFLDGLDERARKALRTPVTIREVDDFPAVDDIPATGDTWLKIPDVVAVVCDLKGSTALSFNRYGQTSARLYEAVTGNSVRVLTRFDAAFIDIQGDGMFGLFHGERAYERAMCAGITLKTLSQKHLIPAIQQWEEASDRFPDTGLKIGMHSGVLVVKKVGVKVRGGEEWKEPVWAGRPVNWAYKCAQAADANQLIATQSVYGKFEDNDYVTHSCGCGAPPAPLWKDFPVHRLPQDKVPTKLLGSAWCDVHGDEFCEAILDGKTSRDDVGAKGLA